MARTGVQFRPATVGDAQRIAELAVQLGYAVTRLDAQRRLEEIETDDRQAVLVAELPPRGVVGWVHIVELRGLLAEPFAEVGGFVVGEDQRGAGVGSRLFEQAVAWTRARGCPVLRIRSNVVRTKAHRFYERLGCRLQKSQHLYVYDLAPVEDPSAPPDRQT